MNHCNTCPIAEGRHCPGDRASRVCDLANPSHPAHRPAYRQSVASAADQREGKDFPPLARQAGNLAGSLWAWAVSGFAIATDEEQARRLAICRGCPEWRDGRCLQCGCALRLKVKLRTEHCPLDPPRW